MPPQVDVTEAPATEAPKQSFIDKALSALGLRDQGGYAAALAERDGATPADGATPDGAAAPAPGDATLPDPREALLALTPDELMGLHPGLRDKFAGIRGSALQDPKLRAEIKAEYEKERLKAEEDALLDTDPLELTDRMRARRDEANATPTDDARLAELRTEMATRDASLGTLYNALPAEYQQRVYGKQYLQTQIEAAAASGSVDAILVAHRASRDAAESELMALQAEAANVTKLRETWGKDDAEAEASEARSQKARDAIANGEVPNLGGSLPPTGKYTAAAIKAMTNEQVARILGEPGGPESLGQSRKT